MIRFMARGPAIFRAPENDEGADYEEGEERQESADPDEEDEIDETGDDEEGSDRGEEDDDGEDEAGEPEGRQAEVGKSRGANRVAEATRIAAEAKAEAAETKRQLAELRAERSQTQQRESQAQRAERLSMMDPEQRTEFLLQEQAQNFQGQLNAIRFEAQDSADRTAFEGMCARNPVAQKHSDAVEQRLREMRAAGTTAPRETVLRWVIGDAALAATPRAKAKQERAAAANKSRQTGRAGSARSDVPADSGRGGTEAQRRAKRLGDMQI